MRLDLVLVRLRFCKSRALAQQWIASGHIRRNGQRATRPDQPVMAGDVLTLPIGRGVRTIAVRHLPDRRGPPAEARACYHELDAGGGLVLPQTEGALRPAENGGHLPP